MEKTNSTTEKEEMTNSTLKTIFISLFTSSIIFAVLYFFKLKNIENFIPKYGFFIFMGIVSYAIIVPSIKYIRSYKEFPCMSGMMIGMTIGMISGFLPGFVIGSTNGMFYGSTFGMFIGITLGIWNGKCCGVMGIMEGTMAGFMGGLMGAMTAVMMLNDNLKLAGIIILTISTVIMMCLNYMIKKETRGAEKDYNKDDFETIVITFVITTLTIWFVTFGPRSSLFQ